MLKLKLVILGILLSMGVAFSSPIGISPTGIKVLELSSSGFILTWNPASITGLDSDIGYFISYNVTLFGPGGISRSTNSTSIEFTGLHPATYYTVKVQTIAHIIGVTESVSFSPVMTSATTLDAPIPDVNTVSTDYTQQASKTVILKAKTRIVLAPGFHYVATGDNYLVTQLLLNAQSSNAAVNAILNPEYYYLEVDKQPANLNDSQIAPEYEVIQPLQGSLLIKNKSYNYSASINSEYYEIIEMNFGKIHKKGYLSGNETQINVSDLKSGFYVVKVSNGKQVYTQKIMIRN